MLTPDSDLEEAESYTVTLSANIKDIAGNSISSSFSWSLSTTVHAIFFSEYVEGSSNNKALEIYNGSASDINQSKLNIYFSATATGPVAIASETLTAGDEWVIGNNSGDQTLLNTLDQASSAVTFNGNDAVKLTYNGITVDVFGQIDVDAAWARIRPCAATLPWQQATPTERTPLLYP